MEHSREFRKWLKKLTPEQKDQIITNLIDECEIAGTVRFEPSVLPYPYWEASGENIDGSISEEDD